MHIASKPNPSDHGLMLYWVARFRLSLQTVQRVVCYALATTMLWCASASAQQFRAAWADVFNTGMASAAEVDGMVSNLVSGRYNAVVVQVLGYMDNTLPSHGAHWKSALVPWSSRVTAGFDPLGYLCQQAHAQGIQVHAWLGGSGTAMYRVSNAWPPAGNTNLALHPEWMMVPQANSEGGAVVGYLVNTTTYYALDMGSAEAQEYIVSIIRELVGNYPVDGIHWDEEIDDPVYNTGMAFPAFSTAVATNSGLARYRRNTGYVGTPLATDPAYDVYRRRFKNELLARVQAEIQSIKSNPRQPVRHSAATMAYGSPSSDCNFTSTTSYKYYSDWPGMLQNGWLDTAIPMDYKTEVSTAYRQWCDRSYACWRYNRDIFIGQGAYLNTKANTVIQLQYAYAAGLVGTCTYSYASPASDGGNWWTYCAANLYTNTATVPAMPWRNPATATEGILWGRVKDGLTGKPIDDAVVSFSSRSLRTDGNGYYVAAQTAATSAGTVYAVTATNTGMSAQTTNATVLAGDVVRYDFVLFPTAPRPPSGLAAAVANAFQINLSWSDNSTNEGGFVVARSTVNGGPYVDVGSVPANTTTWTNNGLSPNTTYYYVVRATNGLGSSVNSVGVAATTPANAAPAITTQPQSRATIVSNSTAFAVSATGAAPLRYQWRFNGSPIPGATTNLYTVPSAQYSDAGLYSVLITNSSGTALSSNASLMVWSTRPTVQLSNVWNIQAGSRTYVTSNSTERGICLNPLTGHVLLVSRSSQISGGLGIFILNATNGQQVGMLSLTGVGSSGTFVLNKIDVADDGVIYAANLTTASSSSPFIIYRWADENATATVAYSGAPDNGTTARWGDTFSVAGSGLNTLILISGSGATNTVLFTTADGGSFAATVLNPNPAGAVAEFSRGLYLLADNTFYAKNRGANVGKVYDCNPAAKSATMSTQITPLDANMLAIGVAPLYNLLAGIVDDNTSNNSGHSLNVYDVSSASAPVVSGSYSFLTFGSGTNSPNANFAGSVDTDGSRIVALDTQNGIVALQLLPSTPAPHINRLALLGGSGRELTLNADPGVFVVQATSDFTNWIDLPVTRTNGNFRVNDLAGTNPARFYRTKN